MRELERRLPGVPIATIDAYGIAEGAKEALVFALIGFLTVHGLPGAIASCTGASHATVLGSIAPAPRRSRSPQAQWRRPDSSCAHRSAPADAGRRHRERAPLDPRPARRPAPGAGDLRDRPGVNLDVAPGEKLGIVGESGSGKTLTILSLLQLLPAPLEILGGSVGFDGEDLRACLPGACARSVAARSRWSTRIR